MQPLFNHVEGFHEFSVNEHIRFTVTLRKSNSWNEKKHSRVDQVQFAQNSP